MTTHFLKAGMRFGDITIIQKVADNLKTRSYNLRKRWRVECVCGTRWTCPQYYLVRKNGPLTHCGCKNQSLQTHYPQEYMIWYMMNRRCTDATHVAYKHYGGRGITVCPEWRDPSTGFKTFFDYMGPRPSRAHTIDRVDNNEGYQPYHPITGERQVRWATPTEQRANQRPRQPK